VTEGWRLGVENGGRSGPENGGTSGPENGGTSRAKNSIRLYTNFSTGPGAGGAQGRCVAIEKTQWVMASNPPIAFH
jgi:hypothetical protein